MWTIAAVNKKFEGPLGSYNGLTDVHLAHFFSQPSRKSHLKAAKLITKDGFIVPEKNVKGELHLHEKKRKVYDILARSVLQNAVHEEGSWNKKLCNYLEDISKMAAVDKARKKIKRKSSKVASGLYLEHLIPYDMSYENVLMKSPLKFENNFRNYLKPPNSAPVTCVCFAREGQQKFANRSLSAKQYSPYGMPLIQSGSYKEQMETLFDTKKAIKHKGKKQKQLTKSVGISYSVKKNNFSITYTKVSAPYHTLKLSQCQVTMFYHGHLHLTNFQKTLTQNIIIKQQHCGGTPVVIFKGNISSNELLSFFTLDHDSFFFSLTIFLNGIRELKLSSCCIFRYLPGRRLGGPNGTFSIKELEGGKPCLNRCQYQEYENNQLKIVSQSSEIPVDASVNIENSTVFQNDIKAGVNDKTSFDNYKPSSPDDSIVQLDNESQKTVDTESHADDEIEEILNEGENQSIKEEVSVEDSIVEERNTNSNEDEIKEKENSDSSISSEDQSEISEKYINDEQKTYQSLNTSSSEDEKENRHIVTASIHKIPEDN